MAKFIGTSAAICSLVLTGCKNNGDNQHEPKCTDFGTKKLCTAINNTDAGCKWREPNMAACHNSPDFASTLNNKETCAKFSGELKYSLEDKCTSTPIQTVKFSGAVEMKPNDEVTILPWKFPIRDNKPEVLNTFERCPAIATPFGATSTCGKHNLLMTWSEAQQIQSADVSFFPWSKDDGADCASVALTPLVWSKVSSLKVSDITEYTILLPKMKADSSGYEATVDTDSVRCHVSFTSSTADTATFTVFNNQNVGDDAKCLSGYPVVMNKDQFANFKFLHGKSQKSCTDKKCVVNNFGIPKCVTQHAFRCTGTLSNNKDASASSLEIVVTGGDATQCKQLQTAKAKLHVTKDTFDQFKVRNNDAAKACSSSGCAIDSAFQCVEPAKICDAATLSQGNCPTDYCTQNGSNCLPQESKPRCSSVRTESVPKYCESNRLVKTAVQFTIDRSKPLAEHCKGIDVIEFDSEETYNNFKVMARYDSDSCTSKNCFIDSNKAKCVSPAQYCYAAGKTQENCDSSICQFEGKTCKPKDEYRACTSRYSNDGKSACSALTDKDCIPNYCSVRKDKDGAPETVCKAPHMACDLTKDNTQCYVKANSTDVTMNSDADVKKMCTFVPAYKNDKGQCYGTVE